MLPAGMISTAVLRTQSDERLAALAALAALGVARVAVARQRRGPVEDAVAARRLDAEGVVEAQLGDAVDVAQRLGQLELARVAQPTREGGDDLALVEPVAARPAHGEDEREAEFLVVVGVQSL